MLVGTRQPKDSGESLESMLQSLSGLSVSARPDWWQPYVDNIEAVQQRMKPVTALHAKLPPDAQQRLNEAVQRSGMRAEQLHYLPLVSRKNLDGWVVLLNAQAEIVGYAPISYFNDS